MQGLPRRGNFSRFEKETILACMERHKNIIGNRTTNAESNKEKATAWIKLTNEFNSVPGVEKSNVLQLQNLYKNLKRRLTKHPNNQGIEISQDEEESKESTTLQGEDEMLLSVSIKREPLPCPTLYKNLKRKTAEPLEDQRIEISQAEEGSEDSTTVQGENDRLLSINIKKEPLPCPNDSDSLLETPIDGGPVLPPDSSTSATHPPTSTSPSTSTSTSHPSSSTPQPSSSTSTSHPSISNSILPSTSKLRPRGLTGYSFKKKRQPPASLKAADALREQSVTRKQAIEAETQLTQQKLWQEMQQSQELHQMKIELHELKLKVLKAKLAYYEGLAKQNPSN